MINFDDVTKEIIKEHDPNGHESLIIHTEYHKPDIDKIYLYAKDPLKQNINF